MVSADRDAAWPGRARRPDRPGRAARLPRRSRRSTSWRRRSSSTTRTSARSTSSSTRAGSSCATTAGATTSSAPLQTTPSSRRHDRRAPALPQRDRPPPAADAGRGDRPRQAHRARRPRGQGPDDQREPAPRRLDRQEVPGLRADAARPDPGGHPGPDPRGREVRLAQGLPLLDLRDVVDPPGGRARDGRQGAHDQAADQPRAQPAQARARGERAVAQARPAADRRRAGRRRPSSRSTTCTRCATPRAP